MGSAPSKSEEANAMPALANNNSINRTATTTTASSVASSNKRASAAVTHQQQQQQQQLKHKASTNTQAQERVKKARDLAGSEESDEFHNACMAEFQKADDNGDGRLDRTEFWKVLHSKTLNLNLSKDEKEELMNIADVDADGYISYAEFVPIVRKLLQRVYQKKTNEWNDWCWFKIPSGQTYYMNKRTGAVQDKRPLNFREKREEEVAFQTITLVDGTEITTMTDEAGQQKYLDFETGEFKPLPSEWLEQTNPTTANTSGDDNILDYQDPRVGEYRHPTRGIFTTFLFENNRNTRLYFDDSMGQWARIPLAWERNVPDVKIMLDELDKAFPEWRNVNEQLLVLRECNYDLSDALTFSEMNWAFRKKKKPGLSRRPSKAVGFADRPAEAEISNLSVPVASYIHDLEVKLATAKSEIDQMKLQLADHTHEQVQTLTREKTRAETTLARKDRDNQEAGNRIADLSRTVHEQRETIAGLEREVVAYKADHDKVVSLEKQLSAQSHGGDADTFKMKSAEAEGLRIENVALKMKLQHVMQKLEFPLANPETARLISTLAVRVRDLQKEKDDVVEETRKALDEMNQNLANVTKAARGLAESIRKQVDDITQKYRAEVLQRKLLYNKVQELRGNIRVFCRVRQDTRMTAEDSVFSYPSPTEVIMPTLQGDSQLVDFDRVYGPTSTQESVFDDTKPLVMSCVDGYNVCIMAYGQTGSGKTFTMMGPTSNIGVNRRAIRELLSLCQSSKDIDYSLTVSMIEVYNEKIFDLLTGDRTNPLDIRQDTGGVFVDGLTEESVTSVEAVESVLSRGDSNRSVGSTAMNTDSSRSHLLFQINVSGYNKISKVTTSGRLTLVDLAGSERISKTEASGARLVEAAAINKSLSALGQVFKALASNAPHIPFRNSKLTHVLQDSLGGDSKTCVFLNCSPLRSNLAESLCTINYGRTIRKVELGPASRHSKAPPRPPKH